MSETACDVRLFIVCGLPGSGKTTLAVQLEQRWNAIRLSPDEWLADLSLDIYDELRRAKIEALQWKLAQAMLARGHAVIIEWGTWTRQKRDVLRRGARSLGAAVELHPLNAHVDILHERIRQRGLENPPIQRDDLLHWEALFEEPTAEELALFDPPLAGPGATRRSGAD
jgi:predicted kinase